MSHIAWDGVPPSDDRLPILVAYPRAGVPLYFRLLGAWQGVWLHWLPPQAGKPKGRSHPCLREGCQFDHIADPPFWFGYAPSLVANSRYSETQRRQVTVWEPAICPVSELMAKGVLSGKELRGLSLRLERQKGRRTLNAEIIESAIPDGMGPAFDVRPILMRMWGLREVSFAATPGKDPHVLRFADVEEPATAKRPRAKGGAS
jgi:hypothetical protein